MTQTKTQQLDLQTFTIWSDEIVNSRLDCFYWMPNIYVEKINKSKFAVRKIKDVVESIKSGTTPKQSEDPFGESDCYFIRNTNIKDNHITFENAKTVKQEIYQKYSALNLQKGDVLICIAGTIGASGVFNSDVKVIFNQNVSRLRFKKDILPEYANLWFNSDAFLSLIDQNATQATIKYVNNDILGSLPIPLPSLPTQNKIVAIMSKAYEEKKRKEERAKKLLSSVDDYVLKELGIKMPSIKKEMVFEVMSDKVENGRIDAEYWQPFLEGVQKEINKIKTQRLEEIITDLSGGATPKVDGDFYLQSNGVPFLRVQNITKAGIDLDNVKYIKKEVHKKELKRSQLKKDDLVFTITGRIGSVAVVPENFEGNINQHSVRFHLKADKNILPEYVAIYLNTNFANLLNLREVTGGTRPALDYKAIKNIKIPISSLAIQNKIVKKVDSIYEESRILQKEAKEVLENAKEKVERIILG